MTSHVLAPAEAAPHPDAMPRGPLALALTFRRAVAVLAVATFALYAAWSLHLFANGTAGWDLAIFDQAVRHYSQFSAPTIPIRGPGYVALGDHFSPVLVLAVPLYWIWADPRMLLLLQAALVAASVPVVARFARRHATPGVALALSAAYALGWPLQQLASFDFHEVAFAVPLLALALDGLDRRSDRTLLLACVGLLLVREDMGLVVACLGLIRACRVRTGWRSRSVGVGLSVVGVLAYEVVTSVVIPHFSVTGTWGYWGYGAIAPDVPGVLAVVVEHPLRVAAMFVDSQVKVYTLVALFIGCVAVLRSPFLLVAAPLLASRFLSARESLWVVPYHYNSVLWPVLFVGALDGARRLPAALRRRVLVATAVVGLVLPAAGLLVVGPYPVFNPHPENRTFLPPATADARAVRSLVPASVCVQAEQHQAVHLVSRDLVTLPVDISDRPDFVLLDRWAPAGAQGPTGSKGPSGRAYERIARAAGYEQVARHGRVVLLRSPGYTGPSARCRP
ncbi:DUF2079 domain-containing protein [Nocardioides mangrovicus]|uniref:DUF2079 domain-containing protein n=1 Tax=Nocardioides mangrovicus TaxID=2478913 RepID=A0A3L8P8W2_9ACTN|nr:DUF2079 domain-containing protein [Nocardioides mangrovicus]RLV51008.1 DUF2079 domain-containing protein [Nocardioides mangrovicus]